MRGRDDYLMTIRPLAEWRDTKKEQHPPSSSFIIASLLLVGRKDLNEKGVKT